MDLSGVLSRTFNPKYAHYYGDGQGRDTYITSNNGGFLQMDSMCIPHTGFTHKTEHSRLYVN